MEYVSNAICIMEIVLENVQKILRIMIMKVYVNNRNILLWIGLQLFIRVG